MPVYEYQCAECGGKLEVRATMREKTQGIKPACPTCGSKQAVAIPSVAAEGSGRTKGASGCCGGAGCCSPKRSR